MADALVSPAVGGVFWAVSGGLIAYSARKVQQSGRDDIVPMMGVMGAFVFAAQMINFAIPGTGSSGHLGGGLMLTMLLGSHAAFLVMASVLAIQALFFADGGLLALGCNMFNLGFFPAFVAYPLFRRFLDGPRANLFIIIAAVAGLLPGALAVVAQTILSGITEIPAGAFTAMMLPIHLAIGIVEGLATAAVVGFVRKSRPETIATPKPASQMRPAIISLLVATALLGGVVSWFASSDPDGLEWSIAKATGTEEIEGPATAVHEKLAATQEKTSFLPDYGFANESTRAGTTTAGLIGGLITFVAISGSALLLRKA